MLVGALVVGAAVVLIKYRSFNLPMVIQDNLENNANYYPNVTKESVYGKP